MLVRKKPVVVEAVLWTGENLEEVITLTGLHESAKKWSWDDYCDVVREEGLKIFTLEGSMLASIGDYIIKGVNGECYPCKPDIFAKTYEDYDLCADDRKKTLDEWPAPRKLETIQRSNALNEVYAIHDPGESGADCYSIWRDNHSVTQIDFQTGPRHDPASTEGVNEIDLLEIDRDRLQHFQQGDYRCRENAIALTHIEEALFWLVKRADDRAARGVLGTHEV